MCFSVCISSECLICQSTLSAREGGGGEQSPYCADEESGRRGEEDLQLFISPVMAGERNERERGER